MVYVPKVFVPGQEQLTSSAPPSSSSSPYAQQQQQQAHYYSSFPAAQQRPSAVPSFSQALDMPPPSHFQPARPSAASSMPPIVQGSYVQQQQQQQPARTWGAAAPSGYSSSMPPSAPYYTQQPQQQPPSYAPNASGYYPGSSNVNSGTGLISQGNPIHCQKVDYEIIGDGDMQLVEIELDPNETIIAEAGAMMYMEDGIEFKTKFGDGSTPNQGFFGKLMAAGGRLMTGESLFLTHFTNTGSQSSYNDKQKSRVAFAAPFPGTIIPIDMSNTDIGGTLICQKDAFLCAAHGTKLSLYFNKRIGSGFFGGEGFLLQKLQGDGMAFIHAGGTVIKKELRGERLRVDTGCLVAFTSGIKFDVQLAPGLKTMIFGGEGLFLATLQGHGTVWIQSLPFSRLADRIVQSAPSLGGHKQDEGTALLGSLGPMISGEGFSGFKLPGI